MHKNIPYMHMDPSLGDKHWLIQVDRADPKSRAVGSSGGHDRFFLEWKLILFKV